MSGRERQTFLHFSVGGTALQIACGLFLIPLCAWAAYTFWFDFESVPEYSRRHQLFADFLRSENGATGAIVFAIFGLCFAWWLWEAGRRFCTNGKAAMLTSQGLVLHSTYRRRGEIPFADVLSAVVERSAYGSWMLRSHHLTIQFRGGRRVQLRSLIIEGGKEALKAFAAELNARRLAARPNQA